MFGLQRSTGADEEFRLLNNLKSAFPWRSYFESLEMKKRTSSAEKKRMPMDYPAKELASNLPYQNRKRPKCEPGTVQRPYISKLLG